MKLRRCRRFSTGKQTVYYVSNEGDPREKQVWSVKTDGTGKQKAVEHAGGSFAEIRSAEPNVCRYCFERIDATEYSICHGAECKPFFTVKPPEGK